MSLEFDRVTGRGLVKTYGPTRALSGLDVELVRGEVTVIEGPNGSGKSTLLSLLALLSMPTRGTIHYGAHSSTVARNSLRGSIGVLSHSAMVYPDLSGLENLSLTLELYGVDSVGERVKELRERFELGPFLERPARTYSRGQLQRVALARALCHRPTLLLLDEPSTGLDASSTERLVHAISEERSRGAIIAVVTHDVSLAEAVATRRIALARGTIQPEKRQA